jgi:putative oxygen-independent coproporphyrinogen III oxidase
MEFENGIRSGADVRHLYVHIPFCPKICPYCSFYKEASDRNKTQAFLEAVLKELDLRTEHLGEIRPVTIFFGGGTPSALTVKQLEFLLKGLRDRLDLAALQEWTLEMNPATVSLEKAMMLRELGVNRISMGVQSWDPAILEALGRVHSAQQARRSYEILREAGFTNVNLDLIFGVPGQSAEIWERSLLYTVNLEPEHISAYCLTYEEDTEFFRRLTRGEMLQDPESDAELFSRTMDLFEQHGFRQYEISNYARPGRECAHNLAYWSGQDYVGLGPSAFSTVGDRRWQNISDTSAYISAIQQSQAPVGFSEPLTASVRRSEALAFGLRTAHGLSEVDVREWNEELADLAAAGYVQTVAGRVRLTKHGRMLADSIAEIFV